MIEMRALEADGLVLEPLTVAHAEAMFTLLSDATLYRYIDEAPPADVEHLRARYARLERRESADGRQRWLNWVLRLPPDQPPLGFVQATVLDNGSAWVAYLLGSAHRGRGHATRATAAMLEHLESEHGTSRLLANVEAENLPSIRLLQRLGFRAATPAEAARHEPTASERIFVRERRAGAGAADSTKAS
jgi:RimJ/RimL family protein N-acetyltransferase